MATIKIINRLESFLALLNEPNHLDDVLRDLSRYEEHFIGILDEFAVFEGTDPLTKKSNKFIEEFNKIINGLKNSYRIGYIFSDIDKLKKDIKEIEVNLTGDETITKLYLELIERFENNLENFIKSYSPSSLITLGITARNLIAAKEIAIDRINTKIQFFKERSSLNDNEKELSIFFHSTNTYHALVIKINNLEELYSNLCLSFNVSTSEYPLRVVKVQTGSLWIDVIGHTAVISAIIWFLTAVVKFIYRNYTLEGKISSIPRQLESANAILQFTEKLEAQGIDTTKNKEQLQLVTAQITNNLNQLVLDQPKLSINGETLSVGDELEKKYLKESEQLLIGDGTK